MKMFFMYNSVNKQSRRNVMPKSAVRFRFIIGLSAALILLFLGAVPHLQAATTFTVFNTNDVGAGSLRQAILEANATTEADVIDFDAGVSGTITLVTSLPTITEDLVITGPGEATLSVSGNDVSGVRPFRIGASAVVTISGLTVEKGNNSGSGGGILNYGVLTLEHVTVRNNEARFGGGIANFGSVLTLEDVTVSNNTADDDGGGIYNEGVLTLTNSTVRDNEAWIGGGIKSVGSRLTLTNSTVNNNTAKDLFTSFSGGGMEVSGTVTLFNSHVDNNSALFTGGIKFRRGGTLTMDDSSTVSYNTNVGIYHADEETGDELILTGGTVSNNSTWGIYNGMGAIMIVNDSTVSDNEVGIRNQDNLATTMTLNRVTVSGNLGTGIENHGTLSLNNSTVSDNTGHGIENIPRPGFLALFLNSSTVSGNGGNGIYSFLGETPESVCPVELTNTIVANNTEDNCAFPATIISLGHNLDSGGTCNLNVALDDLISTNPMLGPLQDNGGHTKTHALLAGSPAIDAGICNYALYPTDQRDIARPQGLYCDIGAYEFVSGDEIDNDSDGFSPPDDCDDDDDTVYPGAPELCDGKDNNCNGEIDEGFGGVLATTISYSGDYVVPFGNDVNVSATVVDVDTNPVADGLDVTFKLDDGSSFATTVKTSSGYAEATFVGVPTGVYTVNIIFDGDDCSLADSQIEFTLAVYGPSAGFVTGGGWIDSPEGAYVVDPSAVGKANFGFVAKYKKGLTVPDGNAEFQFKAVGLNFHSSEYEWLVVTGSDYAMFKGSGTINGEGSYKFMIWAGDGDTTDTFRIKIWEEDAGGNETLTYDNLLSIVSLDILFMCF